MNQFDKQTLLSMFNNDDKKYNIQDFYKFKLSEMNNNEFCNLLHDIWIKHKEIVSEFDWDSELISNDDTIGKNI